jgi:predicted transcriptional regulator
MKKREPVSKIMTTDLHVVKESDTLHVAVELLRKHKIRHIPVMKGEELSGIISRTDVNRLTFGALFDNQEGADEAVLSMLTIPQVMTSNVKSVEAEDSIKDIAEILAMHEFHALPVMENNKLVGIVTTTDIIKYMLEQY